MKTSTADSYFSKCIRASNNYVCVRCSTQYDKSSQGLHCSHNFSRRHRAIRWCKENALPMCYGCHQWFGGNPADSGAWLTDMLGEGVIDILREKMRSKVKVPKSEEALIAKHYREQLKLIEADSNHELESYQ
jgi:hypothetical protein